LANVRAFLGTGRAVRRIGLATAVVLGAAACASAPEPAPPTAEQLYGEGVKLLEGKRRLFFIDSVDYPIAIKKFQDLIENFPFSEYATLSEIKIADAYFSQRKFDEAAGFFQEFIELHPTHPQVPYALLRNGECAFSQILEPDQDQGKAKSAIEQFDVLIARHPGSPEASRATELRTNALDQLAVSEVLVGDFYYGSESYHAAAPRYQAALEKAPRHPGYARTQARLGLSLRRIGQRAEGDRVLGALLSSQADLDDETREELEVELGQTIARREEPSSGFRLWPFGGDETATQAALAPAPAETSASATSSAPQAVTATVEPEPRRGFFRRLWPFGGDDAAPVTAEPLPAAQAASEPAPAPETAGQEAPPAEPESEGWLGWLWPF